MQQRAVRRGAKWLIGALALCSAAAAILATVSGAATQKPVVIGHSFRYGGAKPAHVLKGPLP